MATKKKTKKPSKVRAATAKKQKKTTTPAKKKPKVAAKKAVAAKRARPKARPAKKRAAAKAKPATKAANASSAKKPKVTPRRDGTGHLDPQYAAMLREKSREGKIRDRDDAFVGRKGRSKDDLAEELGETWVQTATSGEDDSEETFNQEVTEEVGGPFVTTTGGQEFADGTDASNPKRSRREPFPTT